ncbi:hypothetical protein J6590_071821 [Homalodisca vitripennis]|nr:hypothetical protein J6590_071821 [Homalodisca vitripennis]
MCYRESNKSMHKDRSPSNISRKSTSSRDKRGFTPPRKPGTNIKMTTRKKSPSPSHRRHNTPTSSSKSKPSTSKSSVSSRPGSKRSVSTERKDKHKRSQSPPRPRSSKTGAPRRPESRPRRSPDTKPRNTSRSRLNGVVYLNFLRDELPNLLDDVPLHLRQNMWFMHEGVPAQYALAV